MKFLSVFLLLFALTISAQTVYKTPSGSKYHLSSCRMVKNVSSALSVEKALKEGLSPCKICKPPFRQGLGIVSKPKKHPEQIQRTGVLQQQKQEHGAREIQV